MKTVPFSPQTDLAPINFDESALLMAQKMKRWGLPWEPHVGCFTWDAQKLIQPASPFPNNVYFILSLPRFIDIFGSIGEIREKLTWVPTWHQARLLCRQLGIADEAVTTLWRKKTPLTPGEEILAMYELLCAALKSA
jgi:hypothetical protein